MEGQSPEVSILNLAQIVFLPALCDTEYWEQQTHYIFLLTCAVETDLTMIEHISGQVLQHPPTLSHCQNQSSHRFKVY